jgi:hypothetical protein
MAKQLSERFGKIMQDRESLSLNSGDTSISWSKQLESAIPPLKISSLSSGDFVGMPQSGTTFLNKILFLASKPAYLLYTGVI